MVISALFLFSSIMVTQSDLSEQHQKTGRYAFWGAIIFVILGMVAGMLNKKSKGMDLQDWLAFSALVVLSGAVVYFSYATSECYNSSIHNVELILAVAMFLSSLAFVA